MRGVFLHILADTLGSIGLIVSSIFVQKFGYNLADPICSVVISLLILSSVLPLLRSSSAILLQGSTLGTDGVEAMKSRMCAAVVEACKADGVSTSQDYGKICTRFRAWSFSPGSLVEVVVTI